MGRTCSFIFPFVLSFAFTASGQDSTRLGLVPWASGMQHITSISHCGDDRLFVTRQGGLVQVITDSMTVLPVPFLNIGNRVIFNGERGLLGMAFHPDYANNGHFYLHYTANVGPHGVSRISRFKVSPDPNVAYPDSELVLIELPQPDPIHQGGDLEFGPDGMLYCSLGDGGGAGDPGDQGQEAGTLFGTIIRIRPEPDSTYSIPPDNPFAHDTTGRRPEIWAYGLRNPYRIGIDPLNGDLWIGDVGQERWEELDHWPGGVATGPNFGWSCYEANEPFLPMRCQDSLGLEFPLRAYAHNILGGDACAIVAGEVYRGQRYPRLQGRFVHTDYCHGRLLLTSTDSLGMWVDSVGLETGLFGFSDISAAADGELFLASRTDQRVYRIVDACPRPRPEIEVNGGTLSTTDDADTWEWYWNGQLLIGADSSSIEALVSGEYTVTITYGDGCTSTSPPVQHVSTAVPGGGQAGRFRLSPVPALDHVTLERDGAESALQVELTDASVRLVQRTTWEGQRTVLALDGVPGGVLWVRVRTRDGRVLEVLPLPVLGH